MKLTALRAFELVNGVGADDQPTTQYWLNAIRAALRMHVRAELEAAARRKKRPRRRRSAS